jgi:undecaprenyl-diphosphatase
LEWWQAVVLGLVEGISEYLPISSTGHLILAAHLVGLGDSGGRTEEAVKAFEVVIQGGAILAVVGLYWPRFVQMLRGLLGQDPAGLRLLMNLAVAFIPAAVIGAALEKTIERRLFSPGPVIAALILGGVYMILLEQWRHGRFSVPRPVSRERTIDDLTPRQAVWIGLLQCVAMWPGTSRSMMTITGGYLVGLRPAAAAEFSFLLGVPTLTGASALKLYKNLSRSARDGTPNLFHELGPAVTMLGLAVAAVSAALAVKWLVSFLGRHGLTAFGWYRIAVGVLMIGLVLGGVLHFGTGAHAGPAADRSAAPAGVTP